MWLIVGVPRIMGGLSCQVGPIQDYKFFLILIIALDSIYLNMYNDIANWSCEVISQTFVGDSSAYEV